MTALRRALSFSAVPLAVCWCCMTPASAATIALAPGQPLAAALAQAVDGDVIEIAAGQYDGQVGVINQKRLTLRGVGGRPVLNAAGRSAEGKAILVVRDGDIRIENIEFRGARVADRNGAGIRLEHGRLQVTRCAFVDNENGILTAGFADAELVVEDSEFSAAPANTPLPHLLYVGAIGRLTVTGSRFSGGRDGHLIKSRARINTVSYNWLVDGPGGQAAYELEFPNGGLAYVVGNVIGQSAGTSNGVIVSYGTEGYGEREHGFYFAHNTVINEATRPSFFIRLRETTPAVDQRVVNNLFIGPGDSRAGDSALGNLASSMGALQDPATQAWWPPPGSPLRGRAVPAGSVRGVSLEPVAELAGRVGTKPIKLPAKASAGAFQ